MERTGIICSILFVYFMVVMPTTGQYCPTDSNPIIEDQTSCTFQIHNDTTAVQNLLKMVANWGYGSIQDINIPVIIHGNDTEYKSRDHIRLHEWVMRYIDPDGPLYYISWRTDFKILSFGLLNEVHSNPGFTLAIDETEGACTFKYGSESTTREIVRTISNYIRESKSLDKTYKYENINMCFLSVFEWFKHSPWYIMKKYFGVPFQGFGYKCCKLYNQTVCCNDKLYNINGYRLIPYILSLLLIGHVPILLLKVATINHTFHPKYYHDFDNISDNISKQDLSLMSTFDNIFCIETKSQDPNENIKKCFKSRLARLLFVLLLPCGIYLEFIMFSLSKDWRHTIEDINNENVLFGFTTMLVDVWNNTFLCPFGSLGLLILYHVTGIFILVLPENFEENVIKEGIVNKFLRNTILEDLNQQGHKNLPGYIQLERVLTTFMFLIFNCKFWTTCMCMVCKCFKCSITDRLELNYRIRFVIEWLIKIVFLVFSPVFLAILVLVLLLFLVLPLIPFAIIILIGYTRFVISQVYCKCWLCTCNNKKNKDAEQNQTRDENIRLISTDNKERCGCQCSFMQKKCPTILTKIAYGCFSVLLMTLFVYSLAIIVSYTTYIIVYFFYFMWWALITSPTETAGVVIFVSGGIVFACKIVNDGISFYKELFTLTIDVCKNEDCTKSEYIAFHNGIIYIKKDIVRKVQQAIYPFYISIGYTIMKLIAVILLYISYFLVINKSSLNIDTRDNFKNVTLVITSALPTLVASKFKHKPPNKYIVKHIVLCYVKPPVLQSKEETDVKNIQDTFV